MSTTARRALLIGSETGGLTGVVRDVDLLAGALADHGFDVTRAVDRDASTDGIREHYEALIAATQPGDAALVYYAGHGGRTAAGQTWLHTIVPTDCDRPDGTGFLLAEELSALQRRLTARSRNTTTVLDCCHSARMSRAPGAVPRARPVALSPAAVEERRRLAHETAPGPAGQDANPDAVRLVACAVDQSAFEVRDPELGMHGALTAALVRALRTPDGSLTWRDVLAVVRPAVRDVVGAQRPEVEGPADRLLFSEERRDGVGVLPVTVLEGRAVLRGAALFGIGVGDRFTLLPPGGRSTDAAARDARVERLVRGLAVLDLLDVADLAPGTQAWPREVSLGRRPVAVAGTDRERAERAVAESARLVLPTTGPVFATLSVDLDGVQVRDAVGLPLYEPPRPASRLDEVVSDLDRIARADHLRDLGSSSGSGPLADVTVRLVRLTDLDERVELGPDAPVHTGDRLLVELHNAGRLERSVAVFDVGVAGAVSVLSSSEIDGLTLAPGERYDLGADWAAASGIVLEWPEGVAPVGPRPETFVVIVAEEPVDHLRALEQPGVARGRARTELDRLLDEVAAGRRDAARPRVSTDEYLVHRLDMLLHPVPRGSR